MDKAKGKVDPGLN